LNLSPNIFTVVMYSGITLLMHVIGIKEMIDRQWVWSENHNEVGVYHFRGF
jgi:hypothetical protein